MRAKVLLVGAAVIAAVSWITASNHPFHPLIGSASVSAAQVRAEGAGVDAAGVRALIDAAKLMDAETAAGALVESVEKARGPEASETADALELMIEARRGLRKSTAPGMAASAFIVPDGAINLVDFSTLPIDRVTPAAAAPGNARASSAPRAGYLVDEPIALHYILAERDLVQPPPEPQGHSLLALGAPDFDKVDRAAAAALMQTPMTVGRASIADATGPSAGGPGAAGAVTRITQGSEASAAPRAACEALSTRTFDPLPGTRHEMQQIAALWRQGTNASRATAAASASSSRGSSPSPSGHGAADTSDDSVMLLGDDCASETAFKMLASGRRVLHLATHGFFLDRSCGSSSPASTTPGSTATASRASAPNASASDGEASAPAASKTPTRGGAALAGARVLEQSPLLRSGLVLAGANRRAEMTSDEDDGVLTAEEIAGLDLSAAQWAVLSACDTGRGDLQAGEGVVGLRRAFQVAGARTVILSLWPVLDTVAADWMTELYRGKFVRGETTATSVRAASRSLLAARRAAGQSTHPLYWSGFIATGDWR